jgi:hypothetical protein
MRHGDHSSVIGSTVWYSESCGHSRLLFVQVNVGFSRYTLSPKKGSTFWTLTCLWLDVTSIDNLYWKIMQGMIEESQGSKGTCREQQIRDSMLIVNKCIIGIPVGNDR